MLCLRVQAGALSASDLALAAAFLGYSLVPRVDEYAGVCVPITALPIGYDAAAAAVAAAAAEAAAVDGTLDNGGSGSGDGASSGPESAANASLGAPLGAGGPGRGAAVVSAAGGDDGDGTGGAAAEYGDAMDDDGACLPSYPCAARNARPSWCRKRLRGGGNARRSSLVVFVMFGAGATVTRSGIRQACDGAGWLSNVLPPL